MPTDTNSHPIAQRSAHRVPAARHGPIGKEARESRVRLVLLDEHSLFRASLSRFLASEAGFEVVGESGAAAEALEILKSSTVDVLLLDFDIRTEQGEDLISAAHQAGYQGSFLIVTGALDVQKSAIALKRGASGIFLKSEAPERLIQAIRLVANGELWVDPKIIQLLCDQSIDKYSQFVSQAPAKSLDDRQRNVLLRIIGGLSNGEIADNMGLSESSVKNIVQQLFAKAEVRSRTQLVRLALEGSWGNVRPLVKRRGDETPSAHSAESHNNIPGLPRQSPR
jgi:two-component system, NarL family, nitrate/nitrite response regulator NarL